MADYRVTIVFDYTVEPDDPAHEIDEDELNDAIRDSFDTVDLEATYDSVVYDDNGDETDDRVSVSFNADNLRELEIVKLDK